MLAGAAAWKTTPSVHSEHQRCLQQLHKNEQYLKRFPAYVELGTCRTSLSNFRHHAFVSNASQHERRAADCSQLWDRTLQHDDDGWAARRGLLVAMYSAWIATWIACSNVQPMHGKTHVRSIV